MAKKKDKLPVPEIKEYSSFLRKVGHGTIGEVSITHEGYPLSSKEEKFISLFLGYGNITKSLREAGLTMRAIAGKEYITSEIQHRLALLRKETIADADEILKYFTAVMRGEVLDQFGLDASLADRTNAAKELARRIIDIKEEVGPAPTIKVTLDWGDM